MPNIAEALEAFLAIQLRQRVVDQKTGRKQLVFVGPPAPVLETLFDRLTASGSRDWVIAGLDFELPVFLVGAAQEPAQIGSRSARTNWDYVVTMRLGVPASLVLVAPSEWDKQPASIDNTSERLGQPRIASGPSLTRADPWPWLLSQLELNTGVEARLLGRAIRNIFTDARELDGTLRETLPWDVAEELLLANKQQLLTDGKLPALLGLPSLAPGIALADGLALARRSLLRLAASCAADGFAELEGKFLAARLERREDDKRYQGGTTYIDDEAAIPAMFNYLRRTAGSGAAFRRSPAVYFRVDTATEAWWRVLGNQVLESLLDATETKRPQGRLVPRVVALVEPGRDEPFVTVDVVEIDVVERSKQGVLPVESASYTRRPAFAEPQEDLEGGHLLDDQVPDHNVPLVYKASVADLKDATVKVIALDHFRCGGHVHLPASLRNPPPARRSRGLSPFEQAAVLRQAGFHRLQVLVASGVARVELRDEQGSVQAQTVHDHKAEITTHVDNGSTKSVHLLDSDGTELYAWDLSFEVAETTEGLTESRFEDLILSHQLGQKERLISPRSSQLRELESQIRASPQSFRGVVACWLPSGATAGPVDWMLGHAGEIPVPPQIDKRPDPALADPPAAYLEARNKVLLQLNRIPDQFVCEVELDDPDLRQSVTEYLLAYSDWLKLVPSGAAWAETVALYVKREGHGVQTVSEEPIVLLLTPYHPLKLAWHVQAQTILRQGLEDSCPLAGLLSPHQTPSITALPLKLGHDIEWRPFIAVPCDDKHWSVLINGDYLGRPEQLQAFAVLKRLGLVPQGITGGMSTGQATRALGDVAGMLSAKATLRVGLVGSPLEEAGSVEGLIGWVEQGYRPAELGAESDVTEEEAEETPVPTMARPSSLEIFDFRDDSMHPSEVRLANLSEDVGGRLRWFHGDPTRAPVLDLVMFDHVGTTSASLRKPEWTATSHSVPGAGSLFRVHIREDQNAGRTIAEARVAHQPHAGNGLSAAVLDAVQTYERLAQNGNNGVSHLVFWPRRQDLDVWIGKARFVTATSSQVDPACFIRSSGEHGDYLWDYELPTAIGTDAGAAGYYLIARPRESMKEAVRRSLAMVVDPPPPAEPVLAEISRRGIPVLKRLASTGTRSKGEIGMLLAVRLLQDVFRADSTGPRLPVTMGSCINMLLAVDSYQSALSAVRKALFKEEPNQRPDLLLFSIKLTGNAVEVKMTPLEVKFHTSQPLSELTAAVGQANSLAKVLKRLWVDAPVNDIWDVGGRALLAKCLDECFRIYADSGLHGLTGPEWAQRHERVIREVLGIPELNSLVTVNAGRVLAFRPGDTTSRAADMNGDGIKDTVIVGGIDCATLLVGSGTLSDAAQAVVSHLNLGQPTCEEAEAGETAPAAVARTSEQPRPDGRLEVSQTLPDNTASVEQEIDVGNEARVPEDLGPEGDGEPEPEIDNVPEASHGGVVPPELRQRVNAAFDNFIGNERPLARIKRDLLVALMTQPPSLKKNYLLEGMPSVGKTELARRIAKAIDLPFIKLDGPTLTSRERLFELINAQLGAVGAPNDVGQDAGQPVMKYPPFVVFVDEIHLVPKKTQESLLTALEAADRSVRLNDRVALVPDATFIFATTQESKLDKAFKSRCTEIELQSYSVHEVALMVRNFVKSEGIDPDSWPADVFPRIAQLGRLVPRRAIDVARELIDELKITDHPSWPIEKQLDLVREVREQDDMGLTPMDIKYLEVLEKADSPLGEDAVASMIETVDRDKVVGEIEPLLRRLQLIARTPQGRVITGKGREYLAAKRAKGA